MAIPFLTKFSVYTPFFLHEIKRTLLMKCSFLFSCSFLLILSTGFGKSYCALELIKQRVKVGLPILIVIPRLVLIENWKKEIKKFGLEEYLPKITFTTYQSLHKYQETEWTCTIYDECHHLSERCKTITENIYSYYNIFLSATVKKDLKDWIIQYQSYHQ